MIAFAATSVITSLAILVAYIFDALPEDGAISLVNSLDRAIISWTRKCFRAPDAPPPYKRKARASLLERFVLVLSDQQLVTGIAVLASGYVNRCTLSTYHFLTVVCLGWFAATVHLSTLTVLRNYFKEFKIIRYVRFAAMIAMGAMLFRGVMVLYGPRGDCTMPVQCLIGNKASLPTSGLVKFCCILFQLSFVVIAYSVKSTKVFLAKHSRFSARAIICKIFRNKLSTIKTRRAQYVSYLRKLSRSRSNRASVKAGLAICSFMFMECLDSFLWQLIWLWFMNFYGIRQVFWAKLWLRGTLGDKLQGNENQWSFGQMVPLLLLVLPALTLIEGYEGKHNISSTRFVRSDSGNTEARKQSKAAAGAASQLEQWAWPSQSPTPSRRQSTVVKIGPTDLTPSVSNDLRPVLQAHVRAPWSQDPTRTSKGDEETPTPRSMVISFAPDALKSDSRDALGAQDASSSVSEGSVASTEDHRWSAWSEFWQECQEAYPSTVCWRKVGMSFITILLLYALVSLATIAWFMAGQYDSAEFRGVSAGIVLVSVLMAAALGPYTVECARLAGY